MAALEWARPRGKLLLPSPASWKKNREVVEEEDGGGDGDDRYLYCLMGKRKRDSVH